jgi:hypothetical protein
MEGGGVLAGGSSDYCGVDGKWFCIHAQMLARLCFFIKYSPLFIITKRQGSRLACERYG